MVSQTCLDLHAGGCSYVVLAQVRVVPLDAVVQDGDHHVSAGVAPLPGRQNIHVGAAAAAVVLTVLRKPQASGIRTFGGGTAVDLTYNVPHAGPFRVIEAEEGGVCLGDPLHSWLDQLLLGPRHLQRKNPFRQETEEDACVRWSTQL